MLPNFLHIGGAKCASSWLWNVCKEHPDIYTPDYPDNVNFFTVHYQRGLNWYEKEYFAQATNETAVGEFSNSYIVFGPALERAGRDLPDVKLTVTVRNPVHATFLAWAHIHLKNKPYGLDPRKGIQIPLAKLLDVHGHAWFRMFVEPNFFGRHIERIYSLFPKERVLVTFHDDLAEKPAEYLERYFGFLGVDPSFRGTLIGKDINPDAADADPQKWMEPEIRAEMHDVFREDIAKLEDLTDRDLSHWHDWP